jgi:hypothetical protein
MVTILQAKAEDRSVTWQAGARVMLLLVVS